MLPAGTFPDGPDPERNDAHTFEVPVGNRAPQMPSPKQITGTAGLSMSTVNTRSLGPASRSVGTYSQGTALSGGLVIGIVSIRDLVRHLIHAQQSDVEALTAYVSGRGYALGRVS